MLGGIKPCLTDGTLYEPSKIKKKEEVGFRPIHQHKLIVTLYYKQIIVTLFE